MQADLRAAFRTLKASKTFTAAAVLALALGIGATSAIYSVVDAVVLRGLPFHEHDRLVAVMELHAEPDDPGLVAPQNYLDWAAEQNVFESLAASTPTFPVVQEPGAEPEELRASQTTASFFDVLRIRTAVGRTYAVANEVNGRHRVAVLSDAFWQRRYAGDPSVIGRVIRLDDDVYEVIGILPPHAEYPVGTDRPIALFVPYVVPESDRMPVPDRFARRLEVIGRLKAGVSFAQAQTRMAQIAAGLRQAHPTWNADTNSLLVPLRDYTAGDRARSWLLLLLGGAGVVLFIACTNVALLQLVRNANRQHEMGVRMAIGAGRWRLARQLLVENVVLALIGAAAGLLLARWGVDVLRSAMPPNVARVGEISLNGWIVLLTTLTSLAVGVSVGIAPAIQLTAPRLALAVQDGRSGVAGSARPTLRRLLVSTEVALAMLLVVGMSLFTRSFLGVARTDPGFDVSHLLTANIALRYRMWPDQDLAEDYARVLDHLQSPAIVAAAVVMGGVPMAGSRASTDILVEGRRSAEGAVGIRRVSMDYHATLRIPMIAGRAFARGDFRGGPPVVIINDALANTYFPGADALGKTVDIHGVKHAIVGVAGDARQLSREMPVRPELDVPLVSGGAGLRSMDQIVLRTDGDPYAVVPAVRRALHEVLPEAPLRGVRSMEDLLARQVAQRKFNMLLLGLFGVLGATIAAVGVFGTVAFTVERRTREIGVRMALGAAPRAVVQLVVAEIGGFVALGLVGGAGAAWGLAATVSAFLFGVDARDPTILMSAGAVMVAAAALASVLPIRRAVRVDPSVTLRSA